MQPFDISEIPNEIKKYMGTIHSIRFPKQGCTSDVAIIECEKAVFALKRTKEHLYNTWLNKEISVLHCLSSKTDLPIPQIKEFKCDKDQTWALIEYLEGATVREALSNEKNKETREEIIFVFGKALSRIHSTSCPAELKYKTPWLDEMLLKATYNFTHYEVNGSEAILNKIQTQKPKNFKQTLIHGDFTIDNVLLHNGKVSGMIDWSGGAYGDPRYDVALAIRPKPNVFENSDREIFFEGYGNKIINQEEYDYFANGLYEFF
ncbi:phosphotransferase [Rummeliibacillus sp. G93]|uniref:phosphotransferase n=1 Tax=Rummeliibacillus sp. G93 TaxID=2939494 RepID=UPI00201C9804|nr:phosphotransferase [Rummeliibacillus sp. G93]UQW98610.1 phosphotransferase [Rummeliibacillus sp. G93]